MRRFAEIIWITFICCWRFFYVEQGDNLAFYLLLAFAGSMLLEILFLSNKPKILSFGVMVCLGISLFFFPNLRYFFPLFAYSSFIHIQWFSLLFVFSVDYPEAVIGASAVYLSFLWMRYHQYIEDNIKKNDELKEQMISLEVYNKKLVDNEEKKQEIVRLEERNRIARELHDSLGHTISSSILQLEALKLTEREQARKDSLQLLQDTLQNGMNGIRSQLHDMYDASFQLNKKLDDLKEVATNLKVEVQNEITSALSFSKNRDIYSIIREALTNTMKHSDADEFHVYLKEQGGNQILLISDNGSREVAKIEEGLGISGIKEVVDKYHGRVNCYYRNGFCIHVVFGAEEKMAKKGIIREDKG